MTEETTKKSKAPVVMGVMFAIAAVAAVGILVLRKRYPWLKNVENADNVSNVEDTDENAISESSEDSDIVIDAADVVVSDEINDEEIVVDSEPETKENEEEKSSYEKTASAVEPKNSKKKVVVIKHRDTPIQTQESDVEETDFTTTAKSMKEAEVVVDKEESTMFEPPAVPIPEFSEEQIKAANEFAAEMKSKEPEFNQVFMIPVSDETIELCGFGVCAALLVRTGYDDKGDFTVRAVINRQGLPSEIKVYGDKADGFKIFADTDEAKAFFQNHIAAATAIKAAPENFEESKRILLQTLAEDVEENP